MLQAHRVAWELRYGPVPDGLCVCHHCDNPGCCNPSHLFLGTHADNMRDMVVKGRSNKGEKHGQAELTWGEVHLIRLFGLVGMTQRAIANRFHVSQTTVWQILHDKHWEETRETEEFVVAMYQEVSK